MSINITIRIVESVKIFIHVVLGRKPGYPMNGISYWTFILTAASLAHHQMNRASPRPLWSI